MSTTSATTLKTYFETGDKPTATEFGELIDGNLNLNDGGTVAGATTFTLAPTLTAGIIGTKIVEQTGTAAEDLTSTAVDTVWVAATTQAGDITLPQATSGNAGMNIKIVAGADWATSAFKLGFASGGSTVMFGTLNVMSHDQLTPAVGFKVTNNSKNLVISSNAAATAGGAKGSVYNFTYIAANLVLVEVNAYISTGTVATDATASVTGGI